MSALTLSCSVREVGEVPELLRDRAGDRVVREPELLERTHVAELDGERSRELIAVEADLAQFLQRAPRPPGAFR